MNVVAMGGNLIGLPVNGSAVSFETADVGLILAAASGLARSLAVGGELALAVTVVTAVCEEQHAKRDKRTSVATFAEVRSRGRSFLGICQDQILIFTCEEQRFEVSLHLVNLIESCRSFRGPDYWRIKLIDGSVYRAERLSNQSLAFVSVAGRQAVRTVETRKRVKSLFLGLQTRTIVSQRPVSYLAIEGAIPEDVLALKRRLEHVLVQNAERIVAVMGKESMNRFFQL